MLIRQLVYSYYDNQIKNNIFFKIVPVGIQFCWLVPNFSKDSKKNLKIDLTVFIYLSSNGQSFEYKGVVFIYQKKKEKE